MGTRTVRRGECGDGWGALDLGVDWLIWVYYNIW